MTSARGVALGPDLSKGATGHPVIYYRHPDGSESFLTADVFVRPNEPAVVYIYCPLCRNHLTIRQDNKAIQYDRQGIVRFPGCNMEEVLLQLGIKDIGGSLSVERFRCAWEIEPSLRRQYGFGVCPWSVAIENNVARNV